MSSYTYNLMEGLLNMRYKILNPMIKTYVEEERKFFGKCFALINNYYNKMNILLQPIPYKQPNYDPMKYTRAKKIMEGVDTSSLPEIKMKTKYSYADYKNNLQKYKSSEGINQNNNNNSINNNNNNDIINKKFSFEDYRKARNTSVDFGNKNISNNNFNMNNINNMNNMSNINNNMSIIIILIKI